MLSPTLIVLILLALGAGIVIWAVRRKPDQPPAGPREGDTARNDPITPSETPPTRDTFTHDNAPSVPPRDPRP